MPGAALSDFSIAKRLSPSEIQGWLKRRARLAQDGHQPYGA
jgi:hypothetical protein